jgi:hypothetical protein
MVDLGATHVRLYVLWRYVQPHLASINTSITVDYVRANPRAIDDWAESSGVEWSGMDAYVASAVASGLHPIVEVFEGTTYGLPRLANGSIADPAILGEERYLGYMYMVARGIARRYVFRHNVTLFQIENELNEAFLAGFAGQRYFVLGHETPWNNWDFLGRVLALLYEAVHLEQPSGAQATMNLHSDIALGFHKLMHVRGFYLDALRDWLPYMDFVSLDAYPNMLTAAPLAPQIVGERITAIRQVLESLGCGDKRIVVMETGFPVLAPALQANGSQVPDVLNFSDARQAEYATAVVESVSAAGGNGLIWFDVVRSPGYTPPGGSFTPEDQEAFQRIGELYLDDRALPMMEWALDPFHWSYLRNRLPAMLTEIDGNWGVLLPDGSTRPAFDALKAAFTHV